MIKNQEYLTRKERFMRFLKIKFFLIIIFFSIGIPVFSQSWWYTLEHGKLLFRSGSYGDALIAFEDARRQRLDQFTRMESDMILLLSNPAVRRLGDSLEFIEQYISANNENAAAAALAELYHRVGKDSLSGSANRVLEELDRLKNYPEADYWLGETYRAEGELNLAFRQYQRAWDNRALLEVPGFDVDILYKMAEIHRLRGEYQEMEKKTLEIIEGSSLAGAPRDSLWVRALAGGSASANQIRSAMGRILENEGVNRFITLYRHDNPVTERAHRLLGFFYYSSNRYSPSAEHLQFAFLIQNTVIINEIVRSQFDYTFTTLNELESQVQSRPVLRTYLEETEYYRTIYYLACALYAAGKNRPARELWSFLSGSSYAGEWGSRARGSPVPVTDRAIELP